MATLPALTVDGVTYPNPGQPVVLVADGEMVEFQSVEDGHRHVKYLQLNGRYPETMQMFSFGEGVWTKVRCDLPQSR